MNRIFHIDMDAFFVAVERTQDLSLVGKPVVVGGEPGKRGVVTCASYEARPYGLKAGMPLSQAQRLCPHAIFIPGRFRLYQEVSERFMDILASFSPFLEPLSLDEAYLDMTGFESIYGQPIAAASAIKENVHSQLGVVASIGIASSKVAAKVASDLEKPDGLVEVPSGEDARFLAPLSVKELPGIGSKTAHTLRQVLKVSTVGELAQVQSVVLHRVFGAWGDLLHLWANGSSSSPVSPPGPSKSISRETTFYEDVREQGVLLRTLRYLAEHICQELREGQRKAQCVTVKVRFADFSTVSRQVALKEPASDNQSVFQMGAQLLLGEVRERHLPVRLIGIGVSDLVERQEQLTLMEGPQQRMERLSLTMDSLRRKYGFTAIQTGCTFLMGRSSHLPELVSSFTRPRFDRALVAARR